jgi:ERCC4-type nuclease
MITININKAKVIAHDKRREARAEEFAPHDEIIMKQIPGVDATAAEAARAAIRTKYATMQTAINSASTVDAIKAAMPQG